MIEEQQQKKISNIFRITVDNTFTISSDNEIQIEQKKGLKIKVTFYIASDTVPYITLNIRVLCQVILMAVLLF